MPPKASIRCHRPVLRPALSERRPRPSAFFSLCPTSVDSVPLWFSWCLPLVSWCLGGVSGERENADCSYSALTSQGQRPFVSGDEHRRTHNRGRFGPKEVRTQAQARPSPVWK